MKAMIGSIALAAYVLSAAPVLAEGSWYCYYSKTGTRFCSDAAKYSYTHGDAESAASAKRSCESNGNSCSSHEIYLGPGAALPGC